VGKGLRPRNDIVEPGWSFWELQNLSMHRVVGLLKPFRQFTDPSDLERDVRSSIAGHFKRAWWRGMAYGVVVESASMQTLDGMLEIVDLRDKRKGTLQWVIVLAPGAEVAIGVHTWIEGYLSPVFRGILEVLESQDYDVTRLTRPKDGLMGIIAEVADLREAVTTFNVKQEAFPEFKDRD
jgi:hypothetical protein